MRVTAKKVLENSSISDDASRTETTPATAVLGDGSIFIAVYMRGNSDRSAIRCYHLTNDLKIIGNYEDIVFWDGYTQSHVSKVVGGLYAAHVGNNRVLLLAPLVPDVYYGTPVDPYSYAIPIDCTEDGISREQLQVTPYVSYSIPGFTHHFYDAATDRLAIIASKEESYGGTPVLQIFQGRTGVFLSSAEAYIPNAQELNVNGNATNLDWSTAMGIHMDENDPTKFILTHEAQYSALIG